MLYTKPKKKISRDGDNDFNLELGCDCAMAFVTKAMIEKLNKKEDQANQKDWPLKLDI